MILGYNDDFITLTLSLLISLQAKINFVFYFLLFCCVVSLVVGRRIYFTRNLYYYYYQQVLPILEIDYVMLFLFFFILNIQRKQQQFSFFLSLCLMRDEKEGKQEKKTKIILELTRESPPKKTFCSLFFSRFQKYARKRIIILK